MEQLTADKSLIIAELHKIIKALEIENKKLKKDRIIRSWQEINTTDDRIAIAELWREIKAEIEILRRKLEDIHHESAYEINFSNYGESEIENINNRLSTIYQLSMPGKEATECKTN